MADRVEDSPVTRHATWVGLRTLRQRPKIVDHRSNGDPIFEVRSVRLVLRGNADHFNRLAECSKCGREVPGAPVLAPPDLDRPTNSVICKDCVRAAAVSAPWQPAGPRLESPALDPAPATPVTPEPAAVAAPAVDDLRLAAVEAQLESALSRLTELASVQAAESFDRRRGDEATEERVREALAQGLVDVRAETGASAAALQRLAALEAHVQQSFASVAELVAGQRNELAAMRAAMVEVRTQIRQLAESSRAVDGMHQELGRRLVDAEARLAAQPTVDQLSEVVDQRIAAAQVGLVRSVDAQQAELQVAQAIDEMRQARDHLQQRLDSLVQQALEAEMRINALASSADAGAGQLHTLEQRIREAVNRFDTSVQERTREVAAWTVDNGAAASVGDDPGGDLVDALERQLQRAEGRLAHVAQYGSQSE
jgi:uncharacterized coiled-coil DUF342 family protein